MGLLQVMFTVKLVKCREVVVTDVYVMCVIVKLPNPNLLIFLVMLEMENRSKMFSIKVQPVPVFLIITLQ